MVISSSNIAIKIKVELIQGFPLSCAMENVKLDQTCSTPGLRTRSGPKWVWFKVPNGHLLPYGP